jgi:hypothetical protein
MEYLRQRRWDVDVVLWAQRDRAGHGRAFRHRYPWIRSARVVSGPARESSFPHMLFAHDRIARSSTVRQLAEQEHDLFVTNQVFAAPVANALPEKCRKLLAAHDIKADSIARDTTSGQPRVAAMARARHAFLWRTELELYRLFDTIVFNNEYDSRRVEPHKPETVHAMPPIHCDAAEPRPPSSDRPGAGTPAIEPFELLLVGDARHANVHDVTFFYREIFVPYLRKHQLRMTVVGGVCEHLNFQDWYVTKLATVPENLDQYYEQAKLTVIPSLQGADAWIQTIALLASGRAVVTSAAAARGLRHDAEAFLQVDIVGDPQDSARRILDLLGSDTRQLRMKRIAREYFRAKFGGERYFRAMDKVMESLGFLPAGSKARALEPSRSAVEERFHEPALEKGA